ncbi:MAG TPA: hypothetical protein PLV08_07855 [Flavobacteriales bacterium]|nr:hypothetical protein [Flavobacteriales bacterium]
MHVIGEVGGSSSRWAFLAQGGTVRILPNKGERLPGFNPLSGDGTVFAQGLREQFEGTAAEGRTVTEVTIYGAGCGTEERKQRMQAAVRTLWPEPHITVGTDLLGAALGLCAPEQGLVLILGTGMNTGYFDGQRLHCPMPSLGYILGDDASGADIGRNLLQDAFYGRIPEQLHLALFGVEGPDLDGVLERIHRGPYPARELASYTVRIAGHLSEPYVQNLLQGRIHALAELIVRFYPVEQRREVVATGSVAYGFREVLAECFLDRGMTIRAVEPDPLRGLVQYHQQLR